MFTYLPQDFRGSLIKVQKERSEKKRQLELETLLSSGGSIEQKYALLWQQQMDRSAKPRWQDGVEGTG